MQTAKAIMYIMGHIHECARLSDFVKFVSHCLLIAYEHRQISSYFFTPPIFFFLGGGGGQTKAKNRFTGVCMLTD